MIEIVFDTETTGLSPADGHRVIEIGCLELKNLVPTGRVFQRFIHPDRVVPEDVIRIHGITNTFLADKPRFDHPDIVDAFLDFIGDHPLVAHNAEFDRGFINAELARLQRPELPAARFIDTRNLARARFPGMSNSLDSLCKRFGISLEGREFHGALKDSQLLALVYLELKGGREQRLDFSDPDINAGHYRPAPRLGRRIARSRLTEDEKRRHRAFVAELGAEAIWAEMIAPEVMGPEAMGVDASGGDRGSASGTLSRPASHDDASK